MSREKETKDMHLVVICPPHSQYAEQPKDQSKSHLIDCPKCKKKMWMSEKKEVLIKMNNALGKEILLLCYICFEKMAKESPEIFNEHIRMDI